MEYAGACYHVINRGNYRRNVFAGEGAAEAFVRTLDETATRFGWRIHAYVVMSNHFHLAVELTEPNLSDGMKWLQGTWVRRSNGVRGVVGRPFQGRYKALLVEPGHVLGQVAHYIHLNPVRAGVVAANEAIKYPWSSLPWWTRKDRPDWLEAETVLREAGGLKDTAKGWTKYQGYLEFLATDAGMAKELVAKRLSRGWCVGGEKFKAAARRDLARRGADLERSRFAGLEPGAHRAERELVWEEKLVKLAQAAEVDLRKLGSAKSAPAKVLLAAGMKQTTSVSNGWLAKRLGMGQPASVSQFVRRALLDSAGRKRIKALLSKVEA
ncbi:transposase [Horticoccus luteus]|uniref:Transposase n=1 Tax=Horticoccus luteus TaxID=2862869 RepID=A0A8F9TZA4_9BACT|nr:transposase [Horticoccus luteus]QYM80629.1 transposase [Horticoccus luteus]